MKSPPVDTPARGPVGRDSKIRVCPRVDSEDDDLDRIISLSNSGDGMDTSALSTMGKGGGGSKGAFPMEVKNLDTDKVIRMGIDSIEGVEGMRSKCKNIQGGISGRMRKQLGLAKEVISTLAERLQERADSSHLRWRTSELERELRTTKQTAYDLRAQIRGMEQEMARMSPPTE